MLAYWPPTQNVALQVRRLFSVTAQLSHLVPLNLKHAYKALITVKGALFRKKNPALKRRKLFAVAFDDSPKANERPPRYHCPMLRSVANYELPALTQLSQLLMLFFVECLDYIRLRPIEALLGCCIKARRSGHSESIRSDDAMPAP